MITPTTAPEPKQSVYHAEFITAGRYLRGWSERTVRTYSTGLATLANTPLTKAGLAAWVVAQRERGLARGGINMYARTINSYLSWLHEEGHVSERLRIKLLPDPPKPLTPISDAEIRRLVLFRPRHAAQRRTWTLVLLLMDGGLRISEALSLDRANVDLHNCVLRVLGNPWHLYVGDDATNTADKIERGRHARGDTSGRAKLTADDVPDMRATFTGRYGETIALARRYGVDPHTIIEALNVDMARGDVDSSSSSRSHCALDHHSL
jgi:integrase